MEKSRYQKYLTVLSVVLFMSLIINIHQYTANKNHSNQMELATISRMINHLEDAKNKSDILIDTYSGLNDLDKVKATSEIRNLLDRSIDFSSMSDNYFPVLKSYSGEYSFLCYQITNGDNPDLEYLISLNQDLALLIDFLYEIDIWNISQEKLFNLWKQYDDRLYTESLKGIIK